MEESFNANFYITVAAVIPVLYIAIVLQGSTYNNLIQRAIKAWHGNLAIYWAARITAYLILTAWVAGEMTAIYALYAQSDTPSIRRLVLASTFLLVLVASARRRDTLRTYTRHSPFSSRVAGIWLGSNLQQRTTTQAGERSFLTYL